MAERTAPSEYEPKRPSRSATSSTDKLRNLYTTGDESGLQPPDDGEAFSGLVPIRRRQG